MNKKFGLVGFYRFLLGREKSEWAENGILANRSRGYHVRGICRTCSAQKGSLAHVSSDVGVGQEVGAGCRERKEAWGLQGYRALFRNYAEVKRGGEEWKTSNARRQTSIAKRQRTAAIQDAGARFLMPLGRTGSGTVCNALPKERRYGTDKDYHLRWGERRVVCLQRSLIAATQQGDVHEHLFVPGAGCTGPGDQGAHCRSRNSRPKRCNESRRWDFSPSKSPNDRHWLRQRGHSVTQRG